MLHKVGRRSSEPISVPMLLNGKELVMEVDTSATLSVISEFTRQSVFPDEPLHSSKLILKTYTDEQMEVKSTLNMRVQYGDQKKKLVLVIMGGDGPSLLGRNWLKYIQLDWSSIFAVRTDRMKPLHTLLQSHQELFLKGNQHTQGLLCLQSSSLQHCLGPSHFSEASGHSLARNPTGPTIATIF